MHPSLGLIGRVVAILLLAMLVEFTMNAVLYERASQFSVRDDVGRRLAEHLVIARRLTMDTPVAERPAMARARAQLGTGAALRRFAAPPRYDR